MDNWGIFAARCDVARIIRYLRIRDIDVYEVRKLDLIEKLTYSHFDPIVFVSDPYIIKFTASEKTYHKVVKKLKLTCAF